MNTHRPLHLTLFILGGTFLAACAAAVNIHCIRQTGYSVSHLTGDIARIPLASPHVPPSRAAATAEAVPALALLAIIALGFIFGAALAGAFIHHPRFEVGRPYGRTLLSVAGLLLVASLVEQRHGLWALPVAAIACGLQNAMSTHYRGLVLRTTHITGVCTDFGQLLGMRLSGHTVETWKLATHFCIFLGFLVGGIVGYQLDLRLPHIFLGLMAGVYTTAGLTWIAFRRKLLHVAGVLPDASA